MKRLHELIGLASDLDKVSRRLRDVVRQLNPAAVGAHQVNCSDESERNCVESFHTRFVREMLPELRYWKRSSFRTVNLGSRYEPGSIGVAEEHYAIDESKDSFKVLVLKLNAHVSLVEANGQRVWGRMDRYERESVYCGALHALMEDADLPCVPELAEAFGPERLACLRDPERVDRHQRALFAALVSAHIQGERAMRDALATKSHTPTLYLIIPSVTLNKADSEDNEIIVGVHTIDERAPGRPHAYVGLSADPSRYELKDGALDLRIVEREPVGP